MVLQKSHYRKNYVSISLHAKTIFLAHTRKSAVYNTEQLCMFIFVTEALNMHTHTLVDPFATRHFPRCSLPNWEDSGLTVVFNSVLKIKERFLKGQ